MVVFLLKKKPFNTHFFVKRACAMFGRQNKIKSKI